MEDNFVYQLSKTLKYAVKGGFEETATIEFTPPNMSVFDESSDFEQLCVGAMMSAAKNIDRVESSDEKDKGEPPSTAEVKMLLLASQDIKFKDIANVFKKIAIKTGKLNNDMPLQDTHFKKMEINDFKEMMCGYAAFFVFPSIMRGE